MIEKPLKDVTENDLVRLVEARTPESKTLEYKQQLPEGGRESKRDDLLADASALANALGGDLIYGIREEDACAAEVTGISVDSIDETVRRVEDMLRDNIAPRMEYELHHFPVRTDRHAIIVRVPQSWNGPHRVLTDSRFYVRNSNSSTPMDVDELRGAFLRSQLLPARMAAFQQERLVEIAAGRVPSAVGDAAKLVLHLLPSSAFASPRLAEREALYGESEGIHPINYDGCSFRITLEGRLAFSASAHNYTHVHRNGIIEAVDGRILNIDHGHGLFIPSTDLEGSLITAVGRYLRVLERLGIPGPVQAHISLVNAEGRWLGTRAQFVGRHLTTIDRPLLLLPPVLLPEFDPELVPAYLRPAFDTLWNAFGYPGSENYEDDGSYRRG